MRNEEEEKEEEEATTTDRMDYTLSDLHVVLCNIDYMFVFS